MRPGIRRTFSFYVLVLAAAAVAFPLSPPPALAQESSVPEAAALWVDQATGQVFARPGRGRVPLKLAATWFESGALEKNVDRNAKDNIPKQIGATQELPRKGDAALTKQVVEMKPTWQGYVNRWANEVHLGTLFYGNYSLYTHTGFGPQFLTQINQPGPGNELYNSFDITRTYLNFLFTPTHDWTIRITPNLYRTLGKSNEKFGATGGLGTSLDGNLGVRIKYAYLQYNKAFENVPTFKGGTITLGQQPNPLVGWEEDLYGFRFVNLTPWNYLSLSSSQTGASVQGPVRLGEKTYFDYDLGVFNNASFHAFEQTNTKEAMVRLSYYPFGTSAHFQGLGITGFYDYGYGNTTPDTADIPTPLKGGNSHVTRAAAIVHYTQRNWSLAGEYDYGKNAFSTGNLFSGSGPGDAFGFGPTPFASFYSMAHAILDTGNATEQGFDVFGHYEIPGSPLTLFGMFQQFEPNTHIGPTNPLDFQRFVVGIGYKYNQYLRFALNCQNLLYYHSQFAFPAIPAYGLTTVVAKPVPHDIHALMLNMEFSY